MSQFTDISSNNPTPDLETYKAAGASIIAIKSTEGDNYHWAEGDTVANEARRIGLHVIRYHFARPDRSGIAQASFFLSHCDLGDTPCLDLEGGGWSPGEADRVWQDFAAVVERHRRPGILYTGAYFAEEHSVRFRGGWRWWLPSYTTVMPSSPNTFPPHPWAWQYTDHGRLSGMRSPGDVSRLLQADAPHDPNPWAPRRLIRLLGDPGPPVFLLSVDGSGLYRQHVPDSATLTQVQDYLLGRGDATTIADVPSTDKPKVAAIRQVPWSMPAAGS
jgi:Glycosyl hydrolases family 25